MAPDAQKDFQRLQRYLTDYFNFWRKGRPQYWNPVVRRQAIELLEVPRPGRWEGFKDPRAAAAGRRGTKRDFGAAFVQEDMNALLHGDLVEDDANGNPRDDLWGPPPVKIARVERENGPSGLRGAAEEGARRIEEANRVAGLRFEKILGWGGLGIAALFAIREPDGRIFKVVCKTDLRADDERSTLGREKEYHIRMAGAKHIVQRVVLQPPEDKSRLRHRVPGRISLAEVNLGARYEDDDGFLVLDKHAIDDHIQKRHKQVLDKRHDVLFLEFMTGGNLQRCLEKVAQQGVRFPDAVLWRIFHCLFQGCIAMAYPDKFQPPGSDPRTTNLHQVSESHHGLPKASTSKDVLVHFDIDPLNILIGSLDEEHNPVPLIKVADLGVARMMDVLIRNDKFLVWGLRRCGKIRIFTPEQFTPEWDFVPEVPLWHGLGEETAGNYHWWTNLYQIGQVMWCLITRCHLQFPPVARPYQACFSKAAVPSGQQAQEWSYGTWLLDAKYDSVDPELRELVVRCMNHRPLARPSFDELAEVFERRLPRQTGAEDAAPGQAAPAASGLDSPLSEQEFCRKFFGEPLAAGTTDWHKAPPPGSEAPPRDEVGGFEETLRPLRVPPPESVQPEMQEGRGPNVKPAYLAPMGETERLELNRIAATAGRGRARRALSRLFGL